jgi:hypothetical protein
MNYTELKTRIRNWLEDDYDEFTTDIDNMIELGEYRISKELNADAMITYQTGNLVVNNNQLAKDGNVVAVRKFNIVSGTKRFPLFFRTTSFLDDYWPDRSKTDRPLYYSNYDETTWQVAPVPDTGYPVEIECEERIIGLSDTVTNTWLSDNAPDLLFYACALEAGVFDQDSEDGRRFAELYDRALGSARAEVSRVRSDMNQEKAG